MNRYIVTSNDGIDTKLANEIYDKCIQDGTRDEIELEEQYSDYEAEIVIGTYEAETEEDAIEMAQNEMIQDGYSNDLINRAIKIS